MMGFGILSATSASQSTAREILDWYHLVENLHKVGGSLKRLHQAETLLWQGKVDETLALFEPLQKKSAQVFCNYVRKHRSRIVNYDYYQRENICSIGSGAVESGIKQMSRRIKISGAQWNEKNVPQVLAHRSAYLNGLHWGAKVTCSSGSATSASLFNASIPCLKNKNHPSHF